MAHKRLTTEAYSSDNDDSYSTYSEEFEHDSRSPTPDNKQRYKTRNKQRSYAGPLESESSSTTFTTTSYNPKKSTQSEQRRRTYNATAQAAKKGWRSSSYSKSSKRRPPASKVDHVHARMLSAQRSRINNLTDELGETQTKIDELAKENKVLRNLQHRQDKALRKFEDKEGELPRLINRHMDDERVLKARLRKAQESERRLEAKLRDREEDVHKMDHTLRKLKKIVYEKNLGERSELAKKLNTTEEKFYEAERKNKELEKKIELSTQSFQRQMNGERMKHRESRQRLQMLQEEFNAMQTKLKEKERALDVSNIYALRSKQSPEKSFVARPFVPSLRQNTEGQPSKDPTVPPLPISSSRELMPSMDNSVPPDVSLPIDDEKPSPSVIEATNGINDFRKTIKTPAKVYGEDKEDSSLLDFGSSNNAASTTNGWHTKPDVTKGEAKPQANEAGDSFFLTNAHGSPNSTFLSNMRSSPPHLQSPPDSLNRQLSPEMDSLEKKKSEQELEEERKKVEEDRRRKAALLAKIKDVEEDKSSSAGRSNKPSDDTFRNLLNGNPATKPARSENKISSKQGRGYDSKLQNSQKTGPSATELANKSPETTEPELSFGGYAPTVTSQPKRKPRAQQKTQRRHTPPGSESDEPLLDVASGKAKKSDFLQQLFGDQAGSQTTTVSNGPTKSEISLSSSQEGSRMKTTPRAKPVHSGYPWERNVVPVTQKGSVNGPLSRKNEILTGPVVKAFPAFNDDDIEEVIL